jgi:hypothetical protein
LHRYNVEHGLVVRVVKMGKVIAGIDAMPDKEKAALAAELRRKGLMPPKEEVPAQTEGLPVLRQGHWDYLIHRYKPKTESIGYPARHLWDPITGRRNIIQKFPVDGEEGFYRDTSVEV